MTSHLTVDEDKNIMESINEDILMADKHPSETAENVLEEDTSGIENVTLAVKTENVMEGSETNIDKNSVTNRKVISMIEKKDKIWYCKVCGKTTKQICQIKNHAETHIDGISFDCNICGKTYKSSSVLSAHKSKCRKSKIPV